MPKIYDEYPTKEELSKILNSDNDPRSNNYKRVLTVPKIKVKSVIINVSIFIIVIVLIVLGLNYIFHNVLLTIFVPLALALIYCMIRLKSIIIFIVECYQILAPKSVRMKCRFEPSCSNYMILSVKKYGAYKGVAKGIKRIKKCKYTNGGYDYP